MSYTPNQEKFQIDSDGTITGTIIKDNTLPGDKIADSTITNNKIADTTITGSKIANTTITGTQIANTTITGSKIANTTITGTQIASTTITSAKLATGTTERDWVLARTAAITDENVVGAYCYAYKAATVSFNHAPGSTVSASTLRPFGSGGFYSSSTLSGTWRVMGWLTGTETSGFASGYTLLVRIS